MPAVETDTIHEEMLNVFFYKLPHAFNTNRSKHFVHLATIIRAPINSCHLTVSFFPTYSQKRYTFRFIGSSAISAGGYQLLVLGRAEESWSRDSQ